MSRRLKDFERDRAERRKVRKRTKNAASAPKDSNGDVIMSDEAKGAATTSTDVEPAASAAPQAGGELEDESVYREKELKELEALVAPDLKADTGSSVSGLYDLVGALILRLDCLRDSVLTERKFHHPLAQPS